MIDGELCRTIDWREFFKTGTKPHRISLVARLTSLAGIGCRWPSGRAVGSGCGPPSGWPNRNTTSHKHFAPADLRCSYLGVVEERLSLPDGAPLKMYLGGW